MDKAVIKHSLLEEPFSISMKIRKKLPIQKNIFELNQPQLRKSYPIEIPMQEESQIPDPLIMDSSLIKSLLFSKIESYLIFVSIIISGIIVYKHEYYQIQSSPGENGNGKVSQAYIDEIQQAKYQFAESPQAKFHLLILETFITILLTIINLIGLYFEIKMNQIRGLENQIQIKMWKVLVFLCHPNIWTAQYNFVFHIILLLRLPFLISYSIKTSTYHSNRSFRLTEIYGIKPNQNFMFAIKSIVQEMTIKDVVLIYILTAFIFSHCLFLGGLSQFIVKPFWSCFQIIVVTLPTIGYGEYQVKNLIQRGIILVAVVVGACLNSLITLIMLKQFQMSSQQTFSYKLLHKLNLKLRMQDISREYIVNTMQQLKLSNFSRKQSVAESRKQLDNRFKEQYKFLKSHYTQISTRDLNSMFDLFKEELKNFKVNCQQMNNMIFVLLSKLHKLEHNKRLNNLKRIKFHKI